MTSKPPFRILYVVPFSDIGGSEQLVLDHLRCLDRTNYEPVFVSLRPGAVVDAAKALGVTTYALHPHKTRELGQVLKAIRQLSQILKKERIDLVFANQGSMLLYCGLAAPRKCPVVWAIHDPLKGSGLFERAFVIAQRRIKPAWVIANSPGTLQSYLAAYPNIRGRNSIIFPGADPALLNKGADAARGRQTLGIPLAVPILSVFARLQSSKGHLYLIPAAAKVLEKFPRARFVIVGDTQFQIEPEYKTELLQAIAAEGIEKSVVMPGYVSDSDKRDILAATDILVHPATWEPFGISVIEGMAVGKPVVAAASEGPKLIVKDGITGLLAPIADQDALADCLLKMLDDPETARAMGAAGYERVKEHYTVEKMVRQAEAVFDSVLRGR
jgi:glycosyltransferase involved in cell wall biosynthesis